MIYTSKPENFNSKFDIVACFLQSKDKFLLIKRNSSKPQGGEWGVPAGKVKEGESLKKACIREVEEETGLKIKDLELVSKFYQKYPNYDFVFYVFKSSLNTTRNVVFDGQEHTEFVWVSPSDSKSLPLMLDLEKVIDRVYKSK